MPNRFDLFGRLARIWRYGWLSIEAIFVVTLAQLVVKFVPFRLYGRWLLAIDGKGEAPVALARQIRAALEFGSGLLPWRPLCLPRAIAGKIMLAARGHASVLTLGVADPDGDMTAHAWLIAGDVIVSGREEMERHKEVAHFGKKVPR